MTVQELRLIKEKISEAEKVLAVIDALDYRISELSIEVANFEIRYCDASNVNKQKRFDCSGIGISDREFDIIRQKVLAGLLELRKDYIKNLELL